MWLSGLQIPESYLTALVQATCRKNGWPLDHSTLYTQVTHYRSEDEVKERPGQGESAQHHAHKKLTTRTLRHWNKFFIFSVRMFCIRLVSGGGRLGHWKKLSGAQQTQSFSVSTTHSQNHSHWSTPPQTPGKMLHIFYHDVLEYLPGNTCNVYFWFAL